MRDLDDAQMALRHDALQCVRTAHFEEGAWRPRPSCFRPWLWRIKAAPGRGGSLRKPHHIPAQLEAAHVLHVHGAQAQAAANRQAIATGMVDANGIPTVPATAIAAVMPPGGVPAAGEPSPDIAPVSTGFGAVSVPLEASLPVATEEVPTGCFPSTSFVPQ